MTALKTSGADWALESNSVFELSSRFLEADLGEEVVLLSINDGRFFSMSDSARMAWGQITSGATLSQVRAQLMEHYDVNELECLQSLDCFITALCQQGILTALTEKEAS